MQSKFAPGVPSGASRFQVMPYVPRVFAIGAVLLFLGMAKPFHSDKPNEWDDVYLRASQKLADGNELYKEVPLYTYPPFMAWLFIPLSMLPVKAARIVWFLICSGSIVTMVWVAWRLANARGPRLFSWGSAPPLWIWLVFGIGLVFGARPAFTALLHHQTDLLMGAIIFLGILALDRDRPGWGAVCFGLAGAMKCTPLLWCAYFLFAGPRRWSLVPVLVAVFANLLPNLTHPPATGSWWLVDWVHAKVFALLGTYPGHWNTDVMCNQSLSGSFYAWCVTTWSWTSQALVITPREPVCSPMVLKLVVYGIGISLLSATLWAIRRQQRMAPASQTIGSLRTWLLEDGLPTYPTRALHYSMILLLMLLLSPMSHKTHFGLLLLPGFLLSRLAWEKGDLILRSLLVALVAAHVATLHFWSVRLSHFAYWHGLQMFTTLFLWSGCLYATLRWGSMSQAKPQAEQGNRRKAA